MQHIAHTQGGRVGEEDKAQVRRRLIVVQAVLPRAERDEGVILAAELAHNVAQGKDGAKDELGVVLGAGG